jgi:predicted MPP superfamily phosphohydrolase
MASEYMCVSLKIPPVKHLALFMLLLLPTVAGYMTWEARNVDITVLSIEGAPQGIVFIADPHVSPSNIDHVREVIDEINRLEPSLVLIGGDFANGGEPDFAAQTVWSTLEAPVYAVLGNHDYCAGIDGTTGLQKMIAVRTEGNITAAGYDLRALSDSTTDVGFADELAATLEQNGVNVLRNEYVRLSIDGRGVIIVGVDDGWAGMADPPVVPRNDDFVLYLIHEPECRADWDADLTLCGHTHGGQFMLPIIQQLNDDGIIELTGLFTTHGPPTYITRGISSSSLAGVDFRFNCRPEILLINPTSEQLAAVEGQVVPSV